jgi:hypothetical protein
MCQEWNTSGTFRDRRGRNLLKKLQISRSFELSKYIDKVNIPCYLSS